jgi:hypothetical protein
LPLSGEKSGWYEYVGVAHIHSTDSDGTKSVPEIIGIGQELGLDFLLFADHLSLNSLHLGMEGWHKDTFVLIGYEIHDQNNINHYLAFDVDEVLPGELTAKEYVKGIKEMGGLGIIAHPDERRDLPQFPPLPWTAWDVEGYDGIEIWNHMSEWMEGINRFNQLKMFLSPRSYLTSPTRKTLRIWDEVNEKRKICGISGVDVHAYPYRLGPFTLTIFPYKVQFQSLRIHLLLRESLSSNHQIAKRQVVNAIRECQLFVSNYRRGDAKGFRFIARGENELASMGDSIFLSSNEIRLRAFAPRKSMLRLLCNGKVIKEEKGKDLQLFIDQPGNYRIEAYRGKKGWIFSNHIRVLAKSE